MKKLLVITLLSASIINISAMDTKPLSPLAKTGLSGLILSGAAGALVPDSEDSTQLGSTTARNILAGTGICAGTGLLFALGGIPVTVGAYTLGGYPALSALGWKIFTLSSIGGGSSLFAYGNYRNLKKLLSQNN